MGARQRAHVRVAVPRLPRRYRAPHGPLQGFGPLPVVDETTVRNNKKGGKREERKRKEAREEGRKESDAGHSLFELAPCAVCVVRCVAREQKKGEKRRRRR